MLEPNFVAATMLRNANKFAEAYYRALQPLCLETDLPPLAVDILLFLANNPAYNTCLLYTSAPHRGMTDTSRFPSPSAWR